MSTNTNLPYSYLFIIAFSLQISTIIGYRTLNNEIVNCSSGDRPKDETKLCYYHYDEDALRERKTQYPIHPMILSRRSHYQHTGQPMSDTELFPLLEAMRWGQSAFNLQPWRIVYAHHGTPKFQEIFSLLVPGNQVWNTNTSVLMIVVTDMWNKYEGNDSFIFTQGFATGTAIGNLLYEGTARGYLVHIMTGYDKERAAKLLGIESNPHFQIEMVISIGKREPISKLQGKKKDTTSQRKSVSDIVSKDEFKKEWRY